MMTDAFRNRIRGDRCVYCGQRANEDEHWPPKSTTDFGYILPVCRECNSFAGTAWPYDFIQRAEYVKEKIAKEYYRELHLTELTCEDLAHQGRDAWLPTLEDYRTKIIAEHRIGWDALGYIAMIDYNEIFVPVTTAEPPPIDDGPEETLDDLWNLLSS
jgi:hypothetical protein